ncbi:MAG: glycosyltransferase family 9 protein [Nitrospirae bacterium]|nr:glycosyltransferase family 9 protein [Nitrospirota bacterium]
MKPSKKIKIHFLKMISRIADVLHLSKKYISDTHQRCLIISTTGIGDTLWGTPAIRALKEKIPGVHLSVLTNVNGEEILRQNPFIGRILVFRKEISNILSLLKELRRAHFDTVIVFHATDRIIWLMAHLTGAGRIIGSRRHSKEMDFIITHAVEIHHNTHAIYARHLLIKELGVKSDLNKIEMFLADNDRGRTEGFLEQAGINKNSFIIGLQPGAAKWYKRWPEENFIKLGKRLSDIRDEVKIIITGDSKEKELAQRIAEKTGGISLAGRLSLREISAVIGRCGIFITNDTGPMHIAAALGTPTVALFSATSRENIEPYRSISTFAAISKPKPCEKCISKACTDPVCMEQISVEEVYEAVKKKIFLNLRS